MNGKLVPHLESEDYFSVEKDPTASASIFSLDTVCYSDSSSFTFGVLASIFIPDKKTNISTSFLYLQDLNTKKQNSNRMKNARYHFLALTLTIMMLLSATDQSHAQMQAPAPSPSAYVSQTVGFTKISIDYSSPGVKGRKIFGELEKYGVPWRAGANAPTTIEFSTAVNIEGTDLNPGTYTLFITPKQSGDWTIHLNSKGNAIYAYMKDEKVDAEALAKDDAVAITVSPVMTTDTQERLTYSISAEDNKVAKVTIAWEKVKLSFMVDTQVDEKMESFKEAFN